MCKVINVILTLFWAYFHHDEILEVASTFFNHATLSKMNISSITTSPNGMNAEQSFASGGIALRMKRKQCNHSVV